MLTAILTVLILGLVILFHEFGHFITAKIFKVYVMEFSLGMGPALYSYQGKETLYSIRALPIGGYVRMAGEDPDDEYYPNAFTEKPPWQRIVISAAGSVMNLFLALLIFIIVGYFAGVPSNQPIIGAVTEGLPAAEAGLLAGDIIIMIDDNPVNHWEDISNNVRFSGGEEKVFTIVRGEETLSFNVLIKQDEQEGRGMIGIFSSSEKGSPLRSVQVGFQQTMYILSLIISTLISMITGNKVVEVSGPIGIVVAINTVSKSGVFSILSFAAMLSLNIGLFNMLPVPPMDGSHIILIIIEAIIGKPLPEKFRNVIYALGLAVLVTLVIVVTYKDIVRLLG